MRRTLRLFTVVVALVPHTLLAQAPPAPPYYAMDPHAPMTPSGNSPLQQQLLENYRAQLLQSQRSLLQQDPSGTSRTQLDINHQLNQYTPLPASPPVAPLGPPSLAPLPAFNPALGR